MLSVVQKKRKDEVTKKTSHETEMQKKQKTECEPTTFLDLLRRLGPFGRQHLFKWNRSALVKDIHSAKRATQINYMDFFKYTEISQITEWEETVPYATTIECLRWLLQRSAPIVWSRVMREMAAKNRVDCLRYLCSLENCDEKERADSYHIGIDFAVLNNNVECLKLLHKKSMTHSSGYEYENVRNAWITQTASRHGYIDCLKYIHEEMKKEMKKTKSLSVE